MAEKNFVLRCVGCNQANVDYSDINECGQPVCEACRAVDDAAVLLNSARNDRPEEFAELLAEAARPFRSGYTDNEVQELIFEASEAARRGDLNMAQHVLRCTAEPKWGSVAECREAYNAAMAEKRGVAA